MYIHYRLAIVLHQQVYIEYSKFHCLSKPYQLNSLHCFLWQQKTNYQYMIFLFLLQENKTPYQLALEQHHSEVAAMLADYRDNGPSCLQGYEKKRMRLSREDKVRPLSEEESENRTYRITVIMARV